MTNTQRKNGLATMAHDRGLITDDTYQLLLDCRFSFDLVESLFDLIENPMLDSSMIHAMAEGLA